MKEKYTVIVNRLSSQEISQEKITKFYNSKYNSKMSKKNQILLVGKLIIGKIF